MIDTSGAPAARRLVTPSTTGGPEWGYVLHPHGIEVINLHAEDPDRGPIVDWNTDPRTAVQRLPPALEARTSARHTHSPRVAPGAHHPGRTAPRRRPALLPSLAPPPGEPLSASDPAKITVVIATRAQPGRLDYLTAMHASLTRQTVPWEAVIALDGAEPARLPEPFAADPRVRSLPLPRHVGAACARNLALNEVRTEFVNWADDDDEFTDDAMAVRLHALEEAGVGWCAGYSEDLHEDGTTALWRCPTPPGRHRAGDVWRFWPDPSDTIPLGPTTILARTDLVRAAPMGGLVQGEDYCTLAVTCLADGILLPVPVYRYRKHAGQMTAQDSYHQLETSARQFAHRFGASLNMAVNTPRTPPIGAPAGRRPKTAMRTQPPQHRSRSTAGAPKPRAPN